MIVEKQMECTLKLAGKTEVLGENLPQRHFCPSQNLTSSDPDLNPGRHDHKVFLLFIFLFIILVVRLLALRPLLAYCASLG
jgi:hypothetical protein